MSNEKKFCKGCGKYKVLIHMPEFSLTGCKKCIKKADETLHPLINETLKKLFPHTEEKPGSTFPSELDILGGQIELIFTYRENGLLQTTGVPLNYQSGVRLTSVDSILQTMKKFWDRMPFPKRLFQRSNIHVFGPIDEDKDPLFKLFHQEAGYK